MYLDSTLILFYIFLLLSSVVVILYLYAQMLKSHVKKTGKQTEDEMVSISKRIEEIQSKTKDITNQAAEEARNKLQEAEDVKQDLIKQLDASFKQIEDSTAKLMNQKQHAFDEEFEEIIAQIRQEALKAKEALNNTELVKQNIVNEIDETIKKVGDRSVYYLQEEAVEFDKQYKEALAKVLQNYVKKSEDTLQLLEKIPEDELSNFKNIMTKETIESQNLMNKKISEEYEQVRQELDSYKKEQIQRIELSLSKFILKVTEEVIGKAIPISDHEQIVLDALDEAKRENLFNP